MNSKVIRVKEYGEIEVPEDFISSSGRLIAYSDVLNKDFFSVRFKKGVPVFQAGGYVGIVPVNEALSIEIVPKVPIANLERIVLLGNNAPLKLRTFRRSYGVSHYVPASIADFLIESFLGALEEVHEHGMLRLYDRREGSGLFPRGRIEINRTVRIRGNSGGQRVTYSWSERHPNNGPNRLFKYVLRSIRPYIEASRNRPLRNQFDICLSFFDQVTDDRDREFLSDPMVADPAKIPSTKDLYIQAISLAKLILRGHGVSLAENIGPISMGSIIVNVDEAFEYYVLAALRRQCGEDSQTNLHVLDGNKGGGQGGMKYLFDESTHPSFINKRIDAKPDIVIRASLPNNEHKILVIDVKYKVLENVADRADLNQIIAYGASYKAKCGVLVLPAAAAEQRGLKCLGLIGQTTFFQYAMNLNAADLAAEEDLLWNTMTKLLEMSA
ncbi:hypothetical protein CIW54_24220 [Paraburkholderia sp. T12-10]|nr:hypothetical protein CIW54_24220 [Paraburkholderia sp. T12-10]